VNYCQKKEQQSAMNYGAAFAMQRADHLLVDLQCLPREQGYVGNGTGLAIVPRISKRLQRSN
jgi:hypothetical protein